MRFSGVLAAICETFFVSVQRAAAQSSADVPLAEQLFQEGQALFRQKRYAEACPKFEESERLDPGGGTLFQLASCHALTGKTASAWAEFDEVALLAKQRNRPDIEQAAREQVRALEPRLSRIVIVVSDAARNVESLSVRRDGTVLGPAALGTAMPVDPGAHEISAGAPGYRPWNISVVLGPDGDAKTVTVPALVVLPKTEPATVAPALRLVTREVRVTKYSPALIYGVLGVGVAGVGLATFFGVESYVKERDARDKCKANPCGDASGVQASKDGVTDANVANVAAAAGIVALGVAAYLFFTNGTATTKNKTALHVAASPVSPLSLGVEGRF
jgi:hypothetical protein